MEHASPFLAIEQLELQIKPLLRGVDMALLAPAEQKTFANIRHLLTDVRLDLRDYELSETRQSQLKCATVAKRRLDKLQKSIVAAGSMFGPADVAQLGGSIEHIKGLVQ